MKFKQPMLHLANNGKLLTVVFLANLLVCSTLFWWAEGNTWFLSLYWGVVSGFTVGYGDVLPTTVGGYLVASYTIIIMWFFVLLVSAKVIVLLVLDQDKFTHEEQEQIKQDMSATRTLLEEVKPMLETIVGNLHTEDEQKETLDLLRSINATITSKS